MAIGVGDKIKIVYSKQLQYWNLLMLVGQRGKVLESGLSESTSGYWVKIISGKNSGEEWFVPVQSLLTLEMEQKKRNIKLIKTLWG